jgi:hypothetical protein
MLRIFRNMEKEVILMFPAMVLLGMMFFMWGAAVWATMHEDEDGYEGPRQEGTLEKRAA